MLFLNINERLQNGNIIIITKTNLAYIEPHILNINGINYLFFNECENVYINTLKDKIYKLKEAYLNDILDIKEYKSDKKIRR